MNHAQVVDHELRLYNQFKAEGKQLLHFCPDWDDMAIHSEMDEIAACCCDFATEADNLLRDQRTQEIEEKRNDPMRATNMMIEAVKHAEMMEETQSTSTDFSSVGAPAHSGTEATNLVVSEARLRTAVAQAREADIDLATAIWGNLLMDCEQVK